MGKGSSGTQSLACEFVTALPHGLKTGQTIVEIPSNTLTEAVPAWDPNYNNGRADVSVPINDDILSVWVTSSTSFAIVTQNNGQLTKGLVANTVGSNATSFLLTFGGPWGWTPGGDNAAPPYEAFCGLVSAIPGCALHTFMPPWATDACANTIFATLAANLPANTPVYIEFVNEHWNSAGGGGGNFQNMFSMAGICAGSASIRANRADDFYTYQAAHYHQLAANAGLNVVRIFGGQAGVSTVTTNMIGFANLYNGTSPANPIRMDAYMSAPYVDVPDDSTFATAAASVFSFYPGSTAYQTSTPWSMGMYLDLLRHFGLYCNAKWITSNTSVISTFNKSLAGQSNTPVATTYEGSWQDYVPKGVSSTDWTLRGAIAHDAFFHPYTADVDSSLHLSNQNAGCSLEVSFDMQNFRAAADTQVSINGTDDADGVVVWGYTSWEGMTWGLGDGTADGNGNDTVNATFAATGLSQDLANVSPKLAGWRNWQATASDAPAGQPGADRRRGGLRARGPNARSAPQRGDRPVCLDGLRRRLAPGGQCRPLVRRSSPVRTGVAIDGLHPCPTQRDPAEPLVDPGPEPDPGRRRLDRRHHVHALGSERSDAAGDDRALGRKRPAGDHDRRLGRRDTDRERRYQQRNHHGPPDRAVPGKMV